MQNNEIAGYQKREQELLNQLSVPLDDRIQDLLQQLKTSHENLLHQQLAQLRRTYLQQITTVAGHPEPMIVISQPSGQQDGAAGTATAAPVTQIQQIAQSDGTVIIMTPQQVTQTDCHGNAHKIEGIDISEGTTCTTNIVSEEIHGNGIVTATHNSDIEIKIHAPPEGATHSMPHEESLSNSHLGETPLQGHGEGHVHVEEGVDEAEVVGVEEVQEHVLENQLQEEEPPPAKRKKES